MKPGSGPDVEIKPDTPSRRFIRRFGEGTFVRLQKVFLNKSAEGAERAGEKVGIFHYLIDKKHRQRTYSNLRFAFPDWTDEKARRTAKDVFRHFGRVGGDFLHSPRRTNEEVLASVVETEGLHNMVEAETYNKGILLITGHFGNWERYAHWMAAGGRKLNVIARETDGDGILTRLVDIRQAAGVNVLLRGNSAREVLIRLRRNETVGILADQNSDEAFAPFFGHPAGTVLGPAVFHKRTSAPLMPCFCVWLGYNRYKVINLPAIDPENLEEDPIKVMGDLNLALESVIREYPEQWLWMHDRWKSARKSGLLEA